MEELHIACENGYFGTVKTLIEQGVPINSPDEDLGYTPLHYAVRSNRLDVAEYLLSKGADVNAHNEKRIVGTPLRESASNCSYEMAKLLIDNGADPSLPGGMNLSALDIAKERKREEGQRVYNLMLTVSK